MDATRSRLAAALILATLAAAAEPPSGGTGADTGDEPVRLDELTVTGRPDPLLAQQRRLRMLLDTSAPCLGCDARATASREGVLAGILRFVLLPAIPAEPDAAHWLAAEAQCADAPAALEFRCR